MSFVTNVLTPIIQISVYLFMVGGLSFLAYKGLKKYFPDFKWTLKYKIFKKKYNDDDVEWGIDAVESGKSMVDIKKFLLLQGKSLRRVEEIIYIFKQIRKQMKGGGDDGRKFEQSYTEDKPIQKISNS